jgi:arginyl-tRNA synthetase
LPLAEEKKFPRVSHVGFGLVLGSDGKRFRTRSSEVVRLVELLDEAKTRSKAELIQRLENNGILFVFLSLILETSIYKLIKHTCFISF